MPRNKTGSAGILPAPSSPAAAFTLIELLIACAISVLVVTAAAATISMGMRAFATISGASSSATAMSAREQLRVVWLLQSDIASAANFGEMRLSGDRFSLVLYRLDASAKTDAAALRIRRVAWSRDAQGRITRTTNAPGDTATAAPVHTETFGHAHTFAFRYGGTASPPSPSAPSPPPSETLWFDEWARPDLPGLIRIELDQLDFRETVMTANFTTEGSVQ